MAFRYPGARATWVPGLVLLALICGSCGTPADPRHRFEFAASAEAIAHLTVDCADCDWSKRGAEAVVLALTLDDQPPMHLPVVRRGAAAYQVMLGPVSAGRHTLTVIEDPALTAESLRGKLAATWSIEIEQVLPDSPDAQALALAPFVHARPDTVGQFTDVPLLMWYEIEPSDRGTRYRYSVIFSNEDGGTPADRLMATWGRTTDIEYIYSVEVDAGGAIIDEDLQGPDHEILSFDGGREGRHPRLWVATHNNMVLARGSTTVRYAPAPVPVNLANVSREKVMDDNPWTYEVMAQELAREGKIVANAPTGKGVIPDLRRYVFVEGCGEAGNNALAVSVNVDGAWLASDRGVEQYRITRNGCFRAAVPLPDGRGVRDVSAVRVSAFTRKDKPAKTPSRLARINTVFSLDAGFRPGPGLLHWEGEAVLLPDGPPFEVEVR